MVCGTCSQPNPPGAVRCLGCSSLLSVPGAETRVAGGGPSEEEAGTRPAGVEELLQELAAAPDQALPLAPGARLGARYRITRLLGRGGMGAVWLARDLELGRDVALKVVAGHLAADPVLLERFRREVQLSSVVTHPNVLRVYDLGEADGVKFLTMQYIEGRTLAELMRDERPLPVERSLALFRQIGEGLAAAHEKEVLHRDLKPQNVMVDREDRAFLTDFGLATSEGLSPVTRTGAVMGTPHYMSPEQVKGEPVDVRSEIFSLGVMLYELLAGALPYKGDTLFEVMMSRTRGPPRPVRELNPGVPPRLQQLVDRCLEMDAGSRYGSVKEILEDLDAGRIRAPARRRLLARRRLALPLPVLVPVLLAAALAAGLGVWRWRAGAPLEGRVSVAVADFDDRTGEPGLEGLSSLLITSLEQSPMLEVLPRSRMRDLLRQSGREAVSRIDEALGREVARLAGTRALIAATLHRFGEIYALEVKAFEPGRERQLFSLKEQGRGKESLPDLLDRVSEGVRRGLREAPESIRKDSVRLAEAVTPNLTAWQHYFHGMDCYERLIYADSYEECLADFQKAASIDPDFSLAHFQVSYLAFWQGKPRGEQRTALEPALRHLERAPPRDRLRIRGWSAYLEGRDAEAKALLRQAAEAAPDDKVGWYLAGEIPFHRDEFAEAVPLFQRASQLEPTWVTPAQHLVYALGSTGRLDELRALVKRVEALPPKSGPLVVLCNAYLWTEPQRAIPACERAVVAGAGSIASDFLAIALLHQGDRKQLDAHLRKMEEASPGQGFAWYMRLLLRGQEGRWAEVLRIAREAGDPDNLWFHSTHAEQLVGLGDRERVWKAALRALEIDRTSASHLAVHLAYAGDLVHAAEFAQYLPPASPRVETFRAIMKWRKGDLGGAIEMLRAIAGRNAMSGDPSVPFPLYLLGEALAEAGQDAEAVEALGRFAAIPLHYPSWEYPRSLFFLARSQERLGNREAARRTIGRLLALWKDADAGQPLLREARALGGRLGVR